MKQQPHNLDAERSLLGGLMIDKGAIHKVMATIQQSDFYSSRHAVIYNAIYELSKADKPADQVVLTEHLMQSDSLDLAGGASYLIELVEATPTAANISHYASIIAEKSRARKIIALSNRAIDQVNKGTPPDEVLSMITTAANNGAQPRGLLTDNYDSINEALDSIERLQSGEKIGYSWGIQNLDNMLFGIRPGQIYIIGARPSRGKTTYADQVLDGMEEKNAFILIEGRPSQLFEKRIYRECGLDPYEILAGRPDWEELNKAAKKQNDTMTDFYKAKTLDEVVSAVYQASSKGSKVIAIDYLQLIEEPQGRTIREKVINISNALSDLPGKLNIALLILAQLSRAHEEDGREPELRDLQESSSIEQCADVVLFIYELKRRKGDLEPGTYMLVKKHRFGQTGYVRVHFDKRRQRFDKYYKYLGDKE